MMMDEISVVDGAKDVASVKSIEKSVTSIIAYLDKQLWILIVIEAYLISSITPSISFCYDVFHIALMSSVGFSILWSLNTIITA